MAEEEETIVFGPTYESFETGTSQEDKELFKKIVHIKEREKQDLLFGRQSYSDILYAHYTPCGPIYSEMKPEIRPLNRKSRAKTKSDDPKTTSRITHDSSLNPNSKIVRRFKQCINQHEMFYAMRKKAIDRIKNEVNPFGPSDSTD